MNTPKTPIMIDGETLNLKYFICPRCKKYVTEICSLFIQFKPEECGWCGQRLDWTEYLKGGN